MSDADARLIAALQNIVAMTNEDSGTFRKRGGTYRGLVGIMAAEALANVKEPPIESVKQDMAALIKRLVYAVRRRDSDNQVAIDAMDYLKRANLLGSIVRDES